jgi:hypothetical protein
VFVNLVKFIRELVHKPALILLENVTGLTQANALGYRPIDAVMNGYTCEADGTEFRYGLKYIPGYRVVGPLFHSSASVGLPMLRRRLFIALVRTDASKDTVELDISWNLALISAHALVPSPLVTFASRYDDSESDIEQAHKLHRETMSAPSIQKSKDLRQQLGLPAYGSMAGHPVSNNPGAFGVSRFLLNKREMDCLDIAILHLSTSTNRPVPEGLPDLDPNFVCDVSQACDRRAWRWDGLLKSPHTGSRVFFCGSIIDHRMLFNTMGWPRDSVIVRPAISRRAMSVMNGNRLATPVVGTVLMACLCEIRLDP